jgi:hypothetical protein
MSSFTVTGLDPATFLVDSDKLRRHRPAKVGKTPIPGSDLVVRDHTGRNEEILTLGVKVSSVAAYEHFYDLLDGVGTVVVDGYQTWSDASLEDVSLDSVDPCLVHDVTLTFSV